MNTPTINTEIIARELAKVRKAVVFSHASPDADALGSMCGIGLILRKLGADVQFVNESPVAPRFATLPSVGEIKTTPTPFDATSVAIICDCGEAKRVGDSLLETIKKFSRSIIIDHHFSNGGFGDLALIRPTASSTCELIFEIVGELEKITQRSLLDSDIATLLFAGLAADTGSFQYNSVTAQTFEIAAQLVKAGARVSSTAQILFQTTTERAVRIQSEALAGIRFFEDKRIGFVHITFEQMKKFQASKDDTEELVERTRNISGVLLAAFAREDEPGVWKVSLRARQSNHDVAAVAQQFGGGGHKAAAGLRFRGDLSTLETGIISGLRAVLKTSDQSGGGAK